MTYRIEVSPREGYLTEAADALLSEISSLGIDSAASVAISQLFFVDGGITREDAERLAAEVLADDVTETFTVRELSAGTSNDSVGAIEVSCKPGVTDTVAETLSESARQLGVSGLERTATATRYFIRGDVASEQLQRIARGLLANEVVEQWSVGSEIEPPFANTVEVSGQIDRIPLRSASDERLLEISKERRLSMNLEEMRAVQEYYLSKDREPTDMELEMLAQTWSEHCVHKTFKAHISYVERSEEGALIPGSEKIVDSMFDVYLKAATKQADKPWIRSVFVDNAGIVAFDDEFDVALKVETHNHPSALEPFGGANTGVGGVVRDILGVSARPIANTDVLCFGPQDVDPASMPDGVLHPKRIAKGVIKGIEDYGNKMGIPTVNGAIVFDPGYTANPLVYCGCLGILPTGSHRTEPQVGDRVVVIGGRTGRDGIGGATFSSMEMTHETGEIAGSSVQIGHPINEKQVQEVVCEARDRGLYTAITDCGAGGLSSSVGEMAEELGASIQLEGVPLKYPGLQPWEIWLSEAQERMVLAVPDESWADLVEICERRGVPVTSIGRFSGDGMLTVRYGDTLVGELSTDFLHNGIPQLRLSAEWTVRPAQPISLEIDEASAFLTELVGTPDLCSRESIVRQYDHEVQGGTAVKPLVGVKADGPGNAAVIVPMAARERGRTDRGVVLGCGVNPHYANYDPRAMAWSAVDEAVRNVVSVGGNPDELSLLDNFCWGNPNKPDRLAGLVLAAQGCYDGAVDYNAPFISGKDSLNNEYTGADGEKHAIPGTILITAMAMVPDVRCTATSDFKSAGNAILVVGDTLDELGGAVAARMLGVSGGHSPSRVASAPKNARAVHQVIRQGFTNTCHDCSEGGLAVALAEMAIGGRLGCEVSLKELPVTQPLSTTTAAFSESNARYILEVSPDKLDSVLATLAGCSVAQIGVTTTSGVRIDGVDGEAFIQVSTEALAASHANTPV
mgnify:CR=1 FL=1